MADARSEAKSESKAEPKSERMKAVENALTQIERAFGKGSIMRLGKSAKPIEVETVSTGSLGLDIALGIGGLPRGRVVEIFGPESSGKTTLALHCVAEAQKKGGVERLRLVHGGTFNDSERGLDHSFLLIASGPLAASVSSGRADNGAQRGSKKQATHADNDNATRRQDAKTQRAHAVREAARTGTQRHGGRGNTRHKPGRRTANAMQTNARSATRVTDVRVRFGWPSVARPPSHPRSVVHSLFTVRNMFFASGCCPNSEGSASKSAVRRPPSLTACLP